MSQPGPNDIFVLNTPSNPLIGTFEENKAIEVPQFIIFNNKTKTWGPINNRPLCLGLGFAKRRGYVFVAFYCFNSSTWFIFHFSPIPSWNICTNLKTLDQQEFTELQTPDTLPPYYRVCLPEKISRFDRHNHSTHNQETKENSSADEDWYSIGLEYDISAARTAMWSAIWGPLITPISSSTSSASTSSASSSSQSSPPPSTSPSAPPPFQPQSQP